MQFRKNCSTIFLHFKLTTPLPPVATISLTQTQQIINLSFSGDVTHLRKVRPPGGREKLGTWDSFLNSAATWRSQLKSVTESPKNRQRNILPRLPCMACLEKCKENVNFWRARRGIVGNETVFCFVLKFFSSIYCGTLVTKRRARASSAPSHSV